MRRRRCGSLIRSPQCSAAPRGALQKTAAAVVLVCCFIDVFCCPTHLASAWSPQVPPLASKIDLDSVSISYPVTLMSKLFSSVPKREFAVDHITTTFPPSDPPTFAEGEGYQSVAGIPTILVGRSASGKSSLLRLISGINEPSSGSVVFNDDRETTLSAAPVIVDRKILFDDRETVLDCIIKSVRLSDKKAEKDPNLIHALAADFASILGLTNELEARPTSLSPSGQFLLTLSRACLMSVLPALPPTLTEAQNEGVQYPIILMDELFDFEHGDIARKCCQGLGALAGLGAVVIIATHKPDHWKDLERRRVLSLSSGRVLSEEFLRKGEGMSSQYK